VNYRIPVLSIMLSIQFYKMLKKLPDVISKSSIISTPGKVEVLLPLTDCLWRNYVIIDSRYSYRNAFVGLVTAALMD
jgi:hypothetical protein